MCLAVPGQILETDGDTAVVNFQGNRAEVCVVLTPHAVPEEWVLVHAGFAIARIDAEEAARTWDYLRTVPSEEWEE